MLHTFHIDNSNGKAKALMDFLRTLEFVQEDTEDWGEFVSEELEASIVRGLSDEKKVTLFRMKPSCQNYAMNSHTWNCNGVFVD